MEANTTRDYGYAPPAPRVSAQRPPIIGNAAREFAGSLSFLAMLFILFRLVLIIK